MVCLQLAIIADDLTGALDAAAPFSSVEGGVVVATLPDALSAALARSPAVVAVSTRSREVPADAARASVAQVLAALPSGVRVIKKVDSRLKGNIAAELEALAAAPLVVLPAIPDFGRVVQDGALRGFGVDVPIPVRPVLGRFADAAEVPEAARQEDIAAAVAAAPPDAVFVGARGLAQAVALRMGVAPPAEDPVLPRPVCLVVGSSDPITLAQVERLRAAAPELVDVRAPSGRVPAPTGPAAPVTLLQATEGEASEPAAVAQDLARGAVPYLQSVRSMLLTGGATAEAVLDALGVAVLSVAGEALPGMALCRAEGRSIVTKSGGFGAPDAFVRLADLAGAEA